jgi:hypothetical protein
MYVLRPSLLPFGRSFSNSNVMVDTVLDEICHPANSILYAARDVTEHLVRAHDIEEVAERC